MVERLRAVEVNIAELPGSLLGLADGNAVTLDATAAGWGWFVDETPDDDHEFLLAGDQGEQDRMDLLSVLMHEMGHVLGLEHGEHDDDVMFESLAAGVRQASADEHVLALLSVAVEFEQAQARTKRRSMAI